MFFFFFLMEERKTTVSVGKAGILSGRYVHLVFKAFLFPCADVSVC